MQNEYGNRMGRQGPPIDNYKTQQEFLSQQTAGGMEFRDCQNPDASDGYIVGPNEKVPGYAPDYIKSQPHRELTEEECARYGLPKGTVLMATQQEQTKGEVPLISEPPDILDPEEQVKQWFKESGATPWTGQTQATFSATGEPVPAKFTMPNYNPAMDSQFQSYMSGKRSPLMFARSPPPGSARPMDVTGYSQIRGMSHTGHG